VDGVAKVWRVPAGTEARELRGRAAGACWSPDGRRLATAEDEVLTVRGSRTGRGRVTLAGSAGAFNLDWSADGRRLAGGGRGNVVSVWEAARGAEVLRLPGHEETVSRLCWSPDGTRLASGSRDQTARVWDAATGRELQCLRGHEHGVTGLAWSADGRTLVSACRHGPVRVWDAATGDCRAVLPGTRDAGAFAAGSGTHPWGALAGRGETVIADAQTGRTVGRFPVALDRLITLPGPGRWAGCAGAHLYVIVLEGPADEDGRTP
jgi:WD40 repeat protein